jgi:Adenylate and Guanylate cyclase catalytic domain
MESEGVPGSVQVSPATYELIKDAYVCEARGLIPVKGKSEMMTYLIVSKHNASDMGDPKTGVRSAGQTPGVSGPSTGDEKGPGLAH